MKFIFSLILPLFTIISNAQSTIYQDDLSELRSILERTYSFKDQIKGDKGTSYNALYDQLVSKSMSDPNSYEYFYNLAQLIFPIRDNHLGFSKVYNQDHFKTKENLDNYIASEEFSNYPKSQLNLDSLVKILETKPAESVEGIYHYDTLYSVALFESGENEYTGVVTESRFKLWIPGQIAIHLYEQSPNKFKAVYGQPILKNFFLINNEKYKNGSLLNSAFTTQFGSIGYSKKKRNAVDHVNLPLNDIRFELKNINKDVQYLLIKTFQANKATSEKSQQFYDSIKNNLTATNLILDLRNNAGGAEKEARKYVQLMKQYVRKGHLYILMNNETLSQAEMFIIELQGNQHITLVGQTSKGMLTYGSNYGRTSILPSGKFKVYPTDMRGKAKHLQYEDVGITPDIFLNDQSNWIDQVIEIIKMSIPLFGN